MKAEFRIGFVLAVLPIFLAACGGIKDQTPKQLTVENHWGGNTGGKGWQMELGGNAISNFVVDLVVLKQAQLGNPMGQQAWAPAVVTKSYWDETGMADGVYSNGVRVDKGDIYNSPHTDSGWPGITYDTTTYNGIKATIERPHVLYTIPEEDPPAEFTPQQIKDRLFVKECG